MCLKLFWDTVFINIHALFSCRSTGYWKLKCLRKPVVNQYWNGFTTETCWTWAKGHAVSIWISISLAFLQSLGLTSWLRCTPFSALTVRIYKYQSWCSPVASCVTARVQRSCLLRWSARYLFYCMKEQGPLFTRQTHPRRSHKSYNHIIF